MLVSSVGRGEIASIAGLSRGAGFQRFESLSRVVGLALSLSFVSNIMGLCEG